MATFQTVYKADRLSFHVVHNAVGKWNAIDHYIILLRLPAWETLIQVLGDLLWDCFLDSLEHTDDSLTVVNLILILYSTECCDEHLEGPLLVWRLGSSFMLKIKSEPPNSSPQDQYLATEHAHQTQTTEQEVLMLADYGLQFAGASNGVQNKTVWRCISLWVLEILL